MSSKLPQKHPRTKGNMPPVQSSETQALHFLAAQGWLPLVLADHAGMVEAYTALFAQSSDFFSLPEESSQKTSVKAISGPAASEEGYSNITDQKSILTIKTFSHCPVMLQEEVKTAWKLTGTLLSKILESIAHTLDLEPDVFSTFADPCVSLPQETRTPTLLRMFRYDRPPGPEAKVNAERHKDLGLLSLVVGHSPGLQVLEAVSGMWVPIEGDQALPAGSKARSGGLTATLLVGETLGFLTRGRYKPGVHGVVCASMEAEMHRCSIVFALRPAVAPIFTQRFESEIVGKFEPEEQADGESSFELFERIRKSHWNVNITPEIRERQREAQRRRKLASDEQVSPSMGGFSTFIFTMVSTPALSKYILTQLRQALKEDLHTDPSHS